MRLALAVAALGRGRTHPNPRVGAVAVRDGRVVGLGAHLAFGGPHAEAALLASTPPADLRGADVYLNLEPCVHHGKTPPCAPALERAGVARVVAAIGDPDPRVRGRGLASLEAAGIATEIGLLEAAARQANAPFLWWQAHRGPWVTVKLATGLDGRAAAADGTSRWISGPEARDRVHRWRAQADAILVGHGTWRTDRPALTARPGGDPLARLRARVAGDGAPWPHQPARVVLDSACRTADDAALLDRVANPDGGGPWIFACGRGAPLARRRRLESLGAACWVLPEGGNGPGVDLEALLARLAGEGHLDILVEGGAALATELLRRDRVAVLRLFVAPMLLGGDRTWVRDLGPTSIRDAVRWGAMRATPVGKDVLLSALSPAAEALLRPRSAIREARPCSPA
jgi:diaminohydroxyphosphoribosylaminopyrimidine deaminase/5-amino-6-(5-phosphoribosylamino)uracil reductase